MSGTPPSRPGMRRHSSAVRFSRGDRSPIGTLTSDDSTQGVARPPNQSAPHDQSGAYDVNAYPVVSETSASGYTNPYYNSEADDTELESRTQRESAASSETITPGSRIQVDPYTATPPRVSTRRMTNPSAATPPPEVRQQFATPPGVHRDDEMVSPRSNPSEWDSPRPDWQPQSATPARRPLPSDSLAQSPRQPGTPSDWGSPRAQWQPQPPSPSPARLPSALKNASPAMQPYTGNSYSPSASPFMGSQQRYPEFPTRRPTETRPSPAFGPPGADAQPGFRQYDADDSTPPEAQAPLYPPTQAQMPFGHHEENVPAEPRFSLSEWQEYQRQQQRRSEHDPDDGQRRQQQWQSDGRHDSDETLRDGYTVNSEKPPLPQGDGRYLQADDGSMRRRTTREMEDDEQSYQVKGGVFSQLLRLAGRSNTQLRRRQMSQGTSSQGEGEAPTMSNLGIRSRASSVASTLFHGEEIELEDPRMTGKKPKHKRPTWEETGYTHTDAHGRRRKSSIQLHVANILTRQRFVMTLAKALMVFGAPSHRVESQLNATASVLEIDAQFIHLPSIVIASFGDLDTRTSETHFIKASGGLDLGKLHRVHRIYRSVVHDEIDAAEGTKQIKALLRAPSIYNVWHRICLSFLSAGIAAPMAFGGSFVDGLASGCLGVLLSFWQLHVASQSSMYSNIFEISIATVISFTARGLSTTGIFCYQAVASAGVTLILPGYVILCGSLELATKNIVAGSVRMVYAIIYSLFLGFGITIGSDMFFVLDRKAKRAQEAAQAASQNFVTMTGSFMPLFVNSSYYPGVSANSPMIPFNGTFTFSNQTASAVDASLKAGHVVCDRPDGLPWYQQNMPRIYCIPLVPIFSLLIALWNMQPIRSKQLPVMITISCIGYLTNTMANKYIFDRSDVVSAIGAFVIGIMGNVYSRVFSGTAFTSMVPGVLFLVPSGISAAGGLAMTNSQNHSDSYSQGLIIGFRMVQVAIGITVGLFGSGLLIYSFGRKKGSALFAF